MGGAARSERTQAMLRHAQRSLRVEWAFWTEEAGWPVRVRVGQPALEKHQSQILSVVTMLEASLAAVTAEAAATPDEDILDLHHVWDFFPGQAGAALHRAAARLPGYRRRARLEGV